MARRIRYSAINNSRHLSYLLLAVMCLWSLAGTAAGATTLTVVPTHSKLGQGQRLSVSVRITGAADLFSAPFYVQYDPRHLKVIAVKQGNFLKRDGASTAFLHKEKRRGTVMVGLSRLGNKPGVSGSGILATLTFITLGAGHTTISLSKSDLKDSQLAPAKVRVENATITIGVPNSDSTH